LGQYDLKIIEGVKVHYLPVAYDNSFGFYKRGFSFLQFAYKAKNLIKKLSRPDVLYITSTPLTTGLIGLWAKRKLAIPFIFEVRDLWPEAPIQVGAIKNKLFQKALYQLEDKIYKQALKIVTLSPGILNYIRDKAGQKEIFLIPNFCDNQFFLPNDEFVSRDLKQKVVISYIGAMGKVNALEQFVYLAKEAQDQAKDWLFVIMGKGDKEKELKKLSKDLGILNLKFYPFGNKYEVRKMLALTAVSYISFAHFPVLRTNCPNKFFDSLSMGKAILINQKGWVYDLVKDHRLGMYHHSSNHRKTVRQLDDFLSSSSALKTAKTNARELALLHFSKEKAVKKLLFVLDPVKYRLDAIDGVYTLTA
jgi:glycosyltransferase involved in cell wall biosynthesis